jgi:hypothetical protein
MSQLFYVESGHEELENEVFSHPVLLRIRKIVRMEFWWWVKSSSGFGYRYLFSQPQSELPYHLPLPGQPRAFLVESEVFPGLFVSTWDI